jgi:hypothetical protein
MAREELRAIDGVGAPASLEEKIRIRQRLVDAPRNVA